MSDLITIHNVTTGKITQREKTQDEKTQDQIDKAAYLTELTELQNKAQARLGLLQRLGLTEDEARLLLS